jgi:hypothetical protein
MEKMSYKSDLARLREEQLAKLRETSGTPERFVVECACAIHDRSFRVTFARHSPAQNFRCESVDKTALPEPTALERLQGFFRCEEALRIRSEQIDFSTLHCAWCGTPPHWTLCAECRTLVCGAHSSGGSFTCRDSCGAQFQTTRLEALTASRQPGTSGWLLLGGGKRLLPRQGLRK